MPTELERLIFQLEANTKGLRNELRTAENTVARSTSKMRKSFLIVDKAVQRTSSAVFSLRGAFIALAGGLVIGKMVRTIASFTQAMKAVQSVIVGVTKNEMKQLEKAARQMGIVTKFSATEAAEGMQELAKNGLNVNEILDAIEPALNLAAAGNIELKEAADLATNSMSGFGLEAKDLTRIVDVYAGTAANANTDVRQLAEAMSFAAPVARGFGLTIEETAAAVATLSNSGIQASRAGTGLKRIITTLANPGKVLKELMGGMSVETDGFEKTLIALSESAITAGTVVDKFGLIAGPAALLLSKDAKNLLKFANALREVTISAKGIADVKIDTIVGDFQKLNAAIDELFQIAGSAGFTGAIRSGTQALTEFFRTVGDTSRILNELETGTAPGQKLSRVTEEIEKIQRLLAIPEKTRTSPLLFSSIGFEDSLEDLRRGNKELEARLKVLQLQRKEIIAEASKGGSKPPAKGKIAPEKGFGVSEKEFAARRAFQKTVESLTKENELLSIQSGLRGKNITFLEAQFELESKMGRKLSTKEDATASSNEVKILKDLIDAQDKLVEGAVAKKRAEDFDNTIQAMQTQANILDTQYRIGEKVAAQEGAIARARQKFGGLSPKEEERFSTALKNVQRNKLRVEKDDKREERNKRVKDGIRLLDRENENLERRIRGTGDLVDKEDRRRQILETIGLKESEMTPAQIDGLDRRIERQERLNRILSLQNQIAEIGERVFDRFGDGIVRTMQEGTSATEAFRDAAVAALFDIQREMLKALVFAPIKSALFGALGSALSFGASGGGDTSFFAGNVESQGFSLEFAKGAAFNAGKVTPFASGGVVNSPTIFPMANGAGLMGEAGPEGILPLSRGNNGKLGVNASGMNGGGSTTIIQIDARGSNSDEGVESAVRRGIIEAAPGLIGASVKRVVRDRQRNPDLFGGSSGEL